MRRSSTFESGSGRNAGAGGVRGVVVAVLAALSLVLTAGCGDGTDDRAFGFRWPVPSRAVVDVTSDEGGEETRARFTLEMVAGPGAEELTVAFSDFEFLAVGDADLSDPGVQKELAPLLALSRSTPPFVVSTAGEFLRIDDWDGVAVRWREAMAQLDPTLDADLAAQTVAMMQSPQARARMRSASARDWQLWAGVWRDLDLEPGQETESVADLPLPWGGRARVPAIVTCLTPDAAERDVHRLEMQATGAGPDFRVAMLSSLENLIPPGQRDVATRERMAAAMTSCAMRYDAAVTLDQATLRPHRAASTEVISITGAGDDAEEQVKKRLFVFDWDQGDVRRR